MDTSLAPETTTEAPSAPTGKLICHSIDLTMARQPRGRPYVAVCFHRCRLDGKYHDNHSYHFATQTSLLRVSRIQRHFIRAIAGDAQ